MAPVTRSQVAPAQAPAAGMGSRSSEGSPGPVDFTILLPTELTASILEQLLPDYADVARASVVCKRISSLATCRMWRSLFVSRWGPATPAQEDAALLAGSWRALFRSKHDTDAASGGWTRPCEFELQAALRRLASRAANAAAADPAPLSGQSKATDPPSPAGPLSAAASAALSPAPSNASISMSISLGSSPPRSSGSPLSSPFVHAAGGGGAASSGAGGGAMSLHRVSSSISSAPTGKDMPASASPARSAVLMAPPSWGAAGSSSRQAPSSVLMLSDVERTPAAVAGGSAPPPPPAPPEVQLVYLLDGSGSVSEDDFAEMRKFVVMSASIICSSLGATEQGKVGVIQFSTEPRVEAPLTPLGNDGAAQLSTALDNMVRMNGGTNIATAIARAGALLKAHDQQQQGGAAGAHALGPDGGPALPPPPPLGPLPLLVDAHLPPELALMEALQDDDEEEDEDEGLPAAMLPVPPQMEMLPPPPPGVVAPNAVGGGPPASGARPVRLLLILTDGRVDTYQAREARLNACRLADELWGCTLAAFGVGRGVDRSELLHIIDTPQGDAASRYLDLYTRDDAPW